MVYTSRYSNPELKTGKYTAVRISLGTPKWPIGYNLDAEMKDLMPFGLLGKFERYEDFESWTRKVSRESSPSSNALSGSAKMLYCFATKTSAKARTIGATGARSLIGG